MFQKQPQGLICEVNKDETPKILSLSPGCGLFLLVLGLLLLFRYAQARGSMMVLAFVFVGAGCTVLGNLLGKWVSRQAEAHFWKNTFHHPPE